MEQTFEDVASNGNKLLIDRNKRCVRCNAYQVLEEIGEGSYVDNLADAMIEGKLVLVCKDDKECAKNNYHQDTKVTLVMEEDIGHKPKIVGYQIFTPDGDVLEVFNDDAPETKYL